MSKTKDTTYFLHMEINYIYSTNISEPLLCALPCEAIQE